jgi:hypothetical protein
MAKLLKSQPSLKVFIVGHTDDSGGLAHNLALSQQRAEAVAKALVAGHGIAPAGWPPRAWPPMRRWPAITRKPARRAIAASNWSSNKCTVEPRWHLRRGPTS